MALNVNEPTAAMQALKHKGVKFVVAPYEADAQMAYLAINGEVDIVITEDSDLLAYGCPKVGVQRTWSVAPVSSTEPGQPEAVAGASMQSTGGDVNHCGCANCMMLCQLHDRLMQDPDHFCQ